MAVVPERIGPFQVLRPIAAGGMAEVYEVVDPISGGRLALKLLVQVEPALKRFMREYEAMTRLNHPGIVRVYHYGLHEGNPWLTMELLRGNPAQNAVKRFGPPSSPQRLAEVLRIGHHVARALHYAHERGLVHRDVKSANVLVLPDERVKLIDFGTAFVVDALERITGGDEFVGTFGYAAPEQIRGESVDGRTDLYALGVLLYRLASGKRPFDDDDHRRLAYKVLHHEPKPLHELVPNLPEDFVYVVDKLLKKDPTQRPKSADVVGRALEQLAGAPFSVRSRIAVHVADPVARLYERRSVWSKLAEGGAGPLALVTSVDVTELRTFVETFVAEASERGLHAEVVDLEETEGLGAVLELFASLSGLVADPDAWASAIRGLGVPGGAEWEADVRRVVGGLLFAASAQPLVLVVHRWEHAGVDGLRLLALVRAEAEAQGLPVAWVATMEPTAPLREAHIQAAAASATSQVDLVALDVRDVALATGVMLGRRPPAAGIARRLRTATGGLPSLVVEAVDALVQRGEIEAEGDDLAWADQHVDVPIPPTAVARAVTAMAGVPAPVARMAQVLVLLGESCAERTLAAGLDLAPDAASYWIDQGVSAGVFARTGRGVDLRLPGLAQAALGQLTKARRRVLLARLRGSLEDAGSGAVRVLVGVSDVEGALARATVEGEAAVQRGAWRSGIEVLERGLHGATAATPGYARAAVAFGTAMATIRPTDGAAARSLARAREVCDPQDVVLRASIDLGLASLHEGLGHYKNFRRFAKSAWDAVAGREDAGTVSARAAFELGRGHALLGEVATAAKWFDKAKALGDSASDNAIVGRAMVAASVASVARGENALAERQAREVLEFSSRVPDPAVRWAAVGALAETLRVAARHTEALDVLVRESRAASQAEHATPYLRLLLTTARCEVDLARLGRAQECMDEVHAALERSAHIALRLEAELVAGSILVASGQEREAAWRLQQVMDRARAAELPVLADVARARLAEANWGLGDRDAAMGHFQSAVLGLLSTGDVVALADAAASYARAAGDRADPTVVFRPVAKLLDGPDAPPFVLVERYLSVAARGGRAGQQATQEAARLLQRIGSRFGDTERAALRVHPVARRVRAGLRG